MHKSHITFYERMHNIHINQNTCNALTHIILNFRIIYLCPFTSRNFIEALTDVIDKNVELVVTLSSLDTLAITLLNPILLNCLCSPNLLQTSSNQFSRFDFIYGKYMTSFTALYDNSLVYIYLRFDR